jgi:hypothetical protein
MKKIILLLILCVSVHTTQANTVINFEDALDGENISYRYNSLGLTLQSISNPYPMTGTFPSPEVLPSIIGDVVIWNFLDPELGKTAVATGQGSPGDGGLLLAFDFDIASLSLQGVDAGYFYGAPGVLLDEDEAVTLTAYDALGNKIGAVFSSVNLPGPYDITPATISFPNMRYVAFNYTGNSYGFYALDNISFSVTSVPEPNSLAMLMAGLVLVGLIQRRRKAN